MTEYVGLLPRRRRTIQTCAAAAAALEASGIQVVRSEEGPLASVIFRTDKPLAPELRAMFSAVSENKVRSLPSPPPDQDPKAIASLGLSPKLFQLGMRVESRDVSIAIRDSLVAIGMERVWADPEWHEGEGMYVGINDTGIDLSIAKQLFDDRVVEHFTAEGISGPNHFHAKVCAAVFGRKYQEYEEPEPPPPERDVLQIWRGMANRVKIYDGRSLNCYGQGTTGTVASVFNWMASRNPKPLVINCSLGSEEHDAVFETLLQELWDMGIITVVAAGNNGIFPPACDGRLNCPADTPCAIAVGATDGGKRTPDLPKEGCMQWAAKNPDGLGRTQIHYVVAPGYGIIIEIGGAGYTGTSLATPHVVGAFIVAFSYPDLTIQEKAGLAVRIVEETCFNLGYDGDERYTVPGKPLFEQPHYCIQGHGRIQVDAVMDRAKGQQPQPPRKVEKVEFFLQGENFATLTSPISGDLWQVEQIIQEEGDYEFKAVAWSKGESQPSNIVRFKVRKSELPTKIVCTVEGPLDDEEWEPGSIPFKVRASIKTE